MGEKKYYGKVIDERMWQRLLEEVVLFDRVKGGGGGGGVPSSKRWIAQRK